MLTESRPAEVGDLFPLAVSVVDAGKMLSVGRTTVLSLIADGELASTTVGRRRVVPVDSLRSYLERRLDASSS